MLIKDNVLRDTWQHYQKNGNTKKLLPLRKKTKILQVQNFERTAATYHDYSQVSFELQFNGRDGATAFNADLQRLFYKMRNK